MVDFDNSDDAWRRYDASKCASSVARAPAASQPRLPSAVSARELFRAYGCSERLYKEAFNPMLLVGLFAPGEACSAAATLGMLYYFILAHQPDFDVVWCRGTVGEKIFAPLVEAIEANGGKFRRFVSASRRWRDTERVRPLTSCTRDPARSA